MISVHETVLDNGLPLVKLGMQGTRAVTLFIAFDAGTRTEHAEENGIAHFLEHLVFKGGERYPTYRDVTHTAERLGAQINAFTTHDVVAFHVNCRAEAVMEAADLLTDYVARAHLDADELERERGVVLQEIARNSPDLLHAPDKDACKWCDYDGVCGADALAQAEGKLEDSKLKAFGRLAAHV